MTIFYPVLTYRNSLSIEWEKIIQAQEEHISNVNLLNSAPNAIKPNQMAYYLNIHLAKSQQKNTRYQVNIKEPKQI